MSNILEAREKRATHIKELIEEHKYKSIVEIVTLCVK